VSITFLEDGVTLNFLFFWQAMQDVSTAVTHTLSQAGNGEPKTHHLRQFRLASPGSDNSPKNFMLLVFRGL
jgi:hypothetical protein